MTALQQLTAETLGRVLVPLGGDPDIKDGALLVHGAPAITERAIDFAEDFSEVPLIPRLRSTAA